MASDAESIESPLRVEAIPVIDLRFISQDELKCLADLSDDLRHLRRDDLVVPKIDRSVFNESAGSRRQTYSRLRLSQKKDDAGVVGGGRRRTGLISVSRHIANQIDDSDHRDDERIVALLRHLFAKDGPEPENGFLHSVSDFAGGKELRSDGTARRDESIGLRKRKRRRKHDARRKFQSSSSQRVHGGNSSSVAVPDGAADVFPLASEDVIFAELGKRTAGLVTEADVLGFLGGLSGRWVSRRKRKKFVDASDFGNVLPKGWKILFGLRRKHGRMYVDIRKYISPNGRQFITDKKVFSELMSTVGQHYPSHSISVDVGVVAPELNKSSLGKSVGVSNITGSDQQMAVVSLNASASCQDKQVGAYTVKNPVKDELRSLLECLKCKVSFQKKDEFVQHLATFHQGSMKYCKPSKTIGKGVIIKDGKYECQICHKVFQEKHRYNGHVGVHVRHYARSLEALPDEITIENVDQSSSIGATSIAHEESSPIGKWNASAADSASLLFNDEHVVSSRSSSSDSDGARYCGTGSLPDPAAAKLFSGATASEGLDDLNNVTSVGHTMDHWPDTVPNSKGFVDERNLNIDTPSNADGVSRSKDNTPEEKDQHSSEFLGEFGGFDKHIEKHRGTELEEFVVNESSTLMESGFHRCHGDTGNDFASRKEPSVGGDEENKLHCELTNSSSVAEQSSCYSPSQQMSLEKVEGEPQSVGEKLEMVPGVEEMPLGDSRPLIFEPMDLDYGAELVDADGMGVSTQPGWDSVLPKMANDQLTTLCVWCRAEFSYEGINPETQSGSVGFMCPTCKAKISGQLNVLDDGSVK